MTTDEAIVALRVLQHQLQDLLDDPQPGLVTWLEACRRTCDRIAEVGKHV